MAEAFCNDVPCGNLHVRLAKPGEHPLHLHGLPLAAASGWDTALVQGFRARLPSRQPRTDAAGAFQARGGLLRA